MNAKTRLGWIRLYEQLDDAGLVCRRCGISRPTLRKWWRRYQAEGFGGLEERSRRPHRAAGRKIFAAQEALILELRRTRQLGIKRLRNGRRLIQNRSTFNNGSTNGSTSGIGTGLIRLLAGDRRSIGSAN